MVHKLSINEKLFMSVFISLFFLGLIGTALGWFGRGDILGESARTALQSFLG